MANLSFKRGLLENLPAAKVAGTVYVTTDEQAVYLDVDADNRIRLSDFQVFATMAALEDNTNPSASALYYITATNQLAKWDGSQYNIINGGDGAVSAVEVVDE